MSVGVSGESHNNWLDQLGNKKQTGTAIETIKLPPVEQVSLSPLDKGFAASTIKKSNNVSEPIFEIFDDPREIVDEIRNAPDQNAKIKGLIEFQGKVDKMSSQDLAMTQEYIVALMKSPSNDDDEMLFQLLKTVNKRIESPLTGFKLPNSFIPRNESGCVPEHGKD